MTYFRSSRTMCFMIACILQFVSWYYNANTYCLAVNVKVELEYCSGFRIQIQQSVLIHVYAIPLDLMSVTSYIRLSNVSNMYYQTLR